MKPLSHERCARRVCCSSWSCTPHDARCEIGGDPHVRRLAAIACERAGLGTPVVRMPGWDVETLR